MSLSVSDLIKKLQHMVKEDPRCAYKTVMMAQYECLDGEGEEYADEVDNAYVDRVVLK